ncbi:hypothetical protein GH741_14100 [Aquibacillus halophilus]|uniref:Signal transduction protein n=1 Tax=Aquibacillus halophilus TaxID=930132 RepID=A0A6A8DH34_9BACI|nr:DUF294 nucleotidyltransferase-like domain-containing protein [Aquibacillus halophilus]MRH43806.1 hypothetical protein [Aquibacillus halophilus]
MDILKTSHIQAISQVRNKESFDRSKEIDDVLNSYADIKKWRKQELVTVSTDHQQLNELHDEVIKKTVAISMDKVQRELGKPPAPFAFFLMGSAGRFEQSVLSDQDHGIIFNGSDDNQFYFLKLGSEITEALAEVGYERCDGLVMSSNPLWCQSIEGWTSQISDWLDEASWQSLRHFSTFFDSRVLVGETDFLTELKQEAFSILKKQPRLYLRLVENVDFVKKGIGIFGQLLPELHGEHSGAIQLKQTTFFPYVNSLRLLALKDSMFEPSTLSRFKELSPNTYPTIKNYEDDFIELLNFRLHFRKNARNYNEVHLIHLDALTKKDKQHLKKLMKQGYKLFSETKLLMVKECSTW